MSIPAKHNLRTHLVGTGEFRFCPGATSAVDARLKGYRDFGNITAFTPETDSTIDEHEGSYRGKKLVDQKRITKQKLDYLLTQDEWKKNNLMLIFAASDQSATLGHTQSALTLGAADTLLFTSDVKSVSDRWYDLFKSSSRIRELTALVIAIAPAASVTADASTDKITESTHGRNNGDPIMFGGTTVPAGLTAGTVYFVSNKSTNDYEVSATVGGSKIDLTSAGSVVTVRKVLVQDTDYEADLTLGCVRFLTERAATVYPIVSIPAVAVGDHGYFNALKPMDDPIITGYGRLIIYDEDDDNQVVIDHADFPCQITAEKPGAIDGKKTSEFQIRVSITSDSADFGTLYIRNDNDEPA